MSLNAVAGCVQVEETEGRSSASSKRTCILRVVAIRAVSEITGLTTRLSLRVCAALYTNCCTNNVKPDEEHEQQTTRHAWSTAGHARASRLLETAETAQSVARVGASRRLCCGRDTNDGTQHALIEEVAHASIRRASLKSD